MSRKRIAMNNIKDKSITDELAKVYKDYFQHKSPKVFDLVRDSSGIDTDGILYINTDLPIEHKSCIYDKEKIKTIIFGDKVREIGKSAFENYPNLETVYYSPNLHTVGKFAFSGCIKLQDFLMDVNPLKMAKLRILDDWKNDIRGCCSICEDLKNIEQEAFSGTAFEGVAVNNDNVNFRAGAFENCNNLEILWSPTSKNLNFGVSSFSGCPKLMVDIDTDGIKRIAKYAFSGTAFAELLSSNQTKYDSAQIEHRLTPTRIKKFYNMLEDREKNSPAIEKIDKWM